MKSGLLIAFGLAVAMTVSLIFVVGVPFAQAGSTIRYVATTGSDANNDCTDSGNPCAALQHAVDVASESDEIRIAGGTYTDVQARQGITQVVYISKTVTLRGGYTTEDWESPDPDVNRTTLDANRLGMVINIKEESSPTIEGLHVTGGSISGIFISEASPVISNCTIISNVGSISSFGYGGGIYLWDSNAILLNNVSSG